MLLLLDKDELHIYGNLLLSVYLLMLKEEASKISGLQYRDKSQLSQWA